MTVRLTDLTGRSGVVLLRRRRRKFLSDGPEVVLLLQKRVVTLQIARGGAASHQGAPLCAACNRKSGSRDSQQQMSISVAIFIKLFVIGSLPTGSE